MTSGSPRINGLALITLGHLLQYWRRVFPSKPALVDLAQGLRLSFAELDERTNRLARGLTRLGLQPGDHVGYLLPDSVQCIEVLFALAKLGAVWCPLNPRSLLGDWRRQLEHANVVALIFHGTLKDHILPLVDTLPRIRQWIAVGSPEAHNPYEQLIQHSDVGPYPIAASPHDPVALLYTSGTTGIPKGALHTHQTLLGWNHSLIASLGWQWSDRILNPYPLFHMGGTAFTIAGLQAGATVFLSGPFDPVAFCQAVDSHAITSTIVVPTMLNAIVQLSPKRLHQFDWSHLTRLATTSAPLMTETYDLTRKNWPHLELFTLYSATEAFFSVLLPKDQERHRRSVGRPAFGMDLRIMDDDGRILAPGEVGSIYGRGMSLFAGYYQSADQFGAFRDGWFTCHDVGYQDADGYLYIIDRKSDLINSGGEKIASVEIEDILQRHPAIREVAVVGMADPYWGERVHAVVSLVPGVPVTADDLIAFAARYLPRYKVPKTFAFVSELPKSATGKILKRRLRETPLN